MAKMTLLIGVYGYTCVRVPRRAKCEGLFFFFRTFFKPHESTSNCHEGGFLFGGQQPLPTRSSSHTKTHCLGPCTGRPRALAKRATLGDRAVASPSPTKGPTPSAVERASRRSNPPRVKGGIDGKEGFK